MKTKHPKHFFSKRNSFNATVVLLFSFHVNIELPSKQKCLGSSFLPVCFFERPDHTRTLIKTSPLISTVFEDETNVWTLRPFEQRINYWPLPVGPRPRRLQRPSSLDGVKNTSTDVHSSLVGFTARVNVNVAFKIFTVLLRDLQDSVTFTRTANISPSIESSACNGRDGLEPYLHKPQKPRLGGEVIGHICSRS